MDAEAAFYIKREEDSMQYILVIAAVIGLDQLIKYLVISQIGMGGEIPVINGFFYLKVIPNDGIAMGMFARHQAVVITLTAVIMIMITVFIFARRKKESPLFLFTLAAIVGGGIGNIIDRIRLNYVIDFLDFRVWPYIFNFADICIVLGCFAMLLFVIRDGRKEKKDSTKEEAEV